MLLLIAFLLLIITGCAGKETKRKENYIAKMTYEVKFKSKDLLSILVTTKGYWGGAHGFDTMRGYTFNLKTGNIILLEDIAYKNK